MSKKNTEEKKNKKKKTPYRAVNCLINSRENKLSQTRMLLVV